MKVLVFNGHFTNRLVEIPLSFWEWLHLKISGEVYVYRTKKKHWREQLPFYIVDCEKHGYYLDYPHGHKEYFTCPKCREEAKNE